MPAATEELLAVRAKAGDLAARDELLRRLHSWVVKSVFKLSSFSMPVEDLTQHGLMGLVQAIATFDMRRGVRFRTHALKRVRGAALDALRAGGSAMIRVPRSSAAQGCLPPRIVPFTQRPGEDSHDEERWTDDPVAPAARTAAELLEDLKPYLQSCSQDERLLVLGCYVQGLTMRQIGQQVGLSESRISQMHTRLLDRLRTSEGIAKARPH